MNIYCIHCSTTGMEYVGQTHGSIEKRLLQHLSNCNRKSVRTQKFATAIRTEGKENFTIRLLEECADQDANQRETEWMYKLDTVKKGYNTAHRGTSNRKGKTNSPESNAKRSETLRKRKEEGLPVGRPKGFTPHNKKYHSKEERNAAKLKMFHANNTEEKKAAAAARSREWRRKQKLNQIS